MTKSIKNLLAHNYKNYWLANRGEYDIYSVYSRPSIFKVRAFERIKDEAKTYCNSSYPIICGHNSSYYTACFVYWDDELDEARFRLYTGRNVYDYAVSEFMN